MRLYLDDVRRSPMHDGQWVTVQNYEDAIMILATCWDDITEVSLDHDLGTLKTGMDVLNYIEESAHNRGYLPFHIYIHSMNFAVTGTMAGVVENLLKRFGTLKREKA